MEGEELREILDALSERTRYAILESLSKRPMTGDEIAESVNRSRSTIESHLSILLRLGLISRRRDDKRYFYEITPKAEVWLNQEIPKTIIEADKERNKFGRRFLFYLPSALTITMLYFFANSFLIPISLWLFALLFGTLSALLCPSLRQLSLSIFVSSLILSVLPSLLVFQSNSLLDLTLSFIVSLTLLSIISFPLWYTLRLALNRAGIHL
ncbi:MAG: winged helix-turn-helix domain-containing protein [Candidatus Methanomethylicaceae archaeon]|nr:winged helix-turn-helix domain-containing protein [Candidatus Verstraetearchaeota archaeon]